MKRRGPHKGKTPARLLEYFKRNPAEELTPKDAAAKLGVTVHSIYTAAGRLAVYGDLECVRVLRLPAKGRAS